MKEAVEIPHAVLRLEASQAEAVVAAFEREGGEKVTSDEVHLLERYFLEHPEQSKGELGKRYREALRKHADGGRG